MPSWITLTIRECLVYVVALMGTECVLDCFSKRFNCVLAERERGRMERIECKNLKYFNNFISSQIGSMFQCQLYVEFVINVTASFIHWMHVNFLDVGIVCLRRTQLTHPPFSLTFFSFHSNYIEPHTYTYFTFLVIKYNWLAGCLTQKQWGLSRCHSHPFVDAKTHNRWNSKMDMIVHDSISISEFCFWYI